MYQEIKNLANKLVEKGIDFSFEKYEDGYEIKLTRRVSYAKTEVIASITEWDGSYGSEADQLEIWGDLLTAGEKDNDSVLGNLSADDVLVRIQKLL